MQAFKIRKAETSDAATIQLLYAPYIIDNHISFEESVPEIEEIAARIAQIKREHLWLILEVENQIAGYAYATTFRTRAAYKPTVETAIYMNSTFQKKGLGYELYKALFEQLKELNFHTAIGVIALPNAKSEAFHKASGFSLIGIIQETGFKNNRFIDVAFYQKML